VVVVTAHYEGGDRIMVTDFLNGVSPFGAQVFTDHKSLLNSGICDILVIATPNMTHAEIVLDVLADPKAHHVLVEKPLCTNIEDCYKVITTCSRLAKNRSYVCVTCPVSAID